MNKILSAVAVAALLAAAPISSFAQSSDTGGKTRAEVRAELVQLEKAGYNPSENDLSYPSNLQAAERRVQAQAPVAQSAAASSYAPEADGRGPRSVYFGQ